MRKINKRKSELKLNSNYIMRYILYLYMVELRITTCMVPKHETIEKRTVVFHLKFRLFYCFSYQQRR